MKNMASTLFGVGACCTPDLPEHGAVAKLRKARFAPLRGGLRPGLTELVGSALKIPRLEHGVIASVISFWRQIAHQEVLMEVSHYVGLYVSQETTSICVVDQAGRVVWRGQCGSDP